MPNPRDPRGVRHALVIVLALTACAVPAGATSLPAVGEWITDAPPSVLERLGVRPDPLPVGAPTGTSSWFRTSADAPVSPNPTAPSRSLSPPSRAAGPHLSCGS
ncbi:transposase family protein [Streptomyces sp. NPDC005279]|uniref:transposase family protein n=1 Tax=Streptomyces sp. NPDC005279 TaxID=3364712 RepID=UPI0036CBB87D